MAQLSLKRLLSRKDTLAVVHQLLEAIAVPVYIQDNNGIMLLGDNRHVAYHRYAVEAQGEILGWVCGEAKASGIATLLSYLANKEAERKSLAQETLDRYKEITVLYNISEKITATLQLQAVATLVLEEAQKLIQGNSGGVSLLDPDVGNYTSVATFGTGTGATLQIQPGQGIVGSVVQTGVGEIVNDVLIDTRCTLAERQCRSLISAPLKSHDQVIGVITLTSDSPINYTSADLKLFNAVASQSAVAIENALLHQQSLREERIKSNLERYVPAQLVQAILDSRGEISLSPTRRHLTILFSDIRNFTTHCEELDAETIVGYLNEYFTHMVEVIFQHQGTVNKFVGDMIVALFGAPSPLESSEKRAIETAIAMQQCLRTIPINWIRDYFHTGIGISSGPVIVGNIGSPQHTDYTAIGDEVNTASRLQSLATGGQILVSRSVYEATQHQFQFKDVGSIQVKGKRRAVEVFEVLYQ